MLKSLELFGFKSFADKTSFDFHPGITGVVGPNGSGKSNVVDGIKWILGDQSPKSLRGKEMTDVIFNGAAGRKGSSFAEATLTFDNSTGYLPVEAREVQIGRRLWRSGDAEYLINKAPARLRDIRELFMGTGAGSAAYSIIEQGRVDQILQANASARRQVFEEAAGISLYKSRKTDAVRRLGRVDQNLQRLTDIVDEVEGQLTATRSQAAKAAKYRELSNELRDLWLGLAADDSRHHTGELEEIEQAIAGYTAELESLNTAQQELETQLAALDTEIAEVDERLRGVERRRGANRETIARHESTLRHEAARKRELEADVVRLRKQRAVMVARMAEVHEELDHHLTVLEQSEQECARQQAELTAFEEQGRDLDASLEAERGRIEERRRQLKELLREVSASEGRVANCESQLSRLAEAKQGVEARLTDLDEQIAVCRSECERRQLRVEEASVQVALVDEQVQELRGRRDELLQEHDQSQRTLAGQREQRSAWQARKAVLEDLEQRQEGFGIGVREILNRAATSDYPPWNRILGSVADLLDADLDQAALLEVALGGRSQLLVIEEFEPLIDYLHRASTSISGRVGFVAHPVSSPCSFDGGQGDGSVAGSERVEAFGPPPGPLPGGEGIGEEDDRTGGISGGVYEHVAATACDLSAEPGVLMRADRLVRGSERAPGLPERVLADTWVVVDLDCAMRLASGRGRGCRFVTPLGELLDADGTLTVGSVRSETAVVSRKSELRRLKNDLLRLERRIGEEERRIAGVNDSVSGLETGLREVESQLQELAELYSELKADLASQERELERLRQSRAEAAGELDGLALQQQQIADQLEQAHRDRERAQSDLQVHEAAIEESEREIGRLELRLEALGQQKAAARLELAKHDERLASLRSSWKRLEQDQQQRAQQLDEALRRFEFVAAKQVEIDLHLLNSSSELAALYLADEASQSAARAVAAEKQEMRAGRSKLVEEEGRLRRRRRDLTEKQHRQEMRAHELRSQLAALQQRIDEEYQLPLAEVVASGVSAYRGYVDELLGDAKPQAEGDDAGGEAASADDGVGERESTSRWQEIGAQEPPQFEEVRGELEERVNRLRRKIKHMGAVNTDSLDDLDELEARYERLKSQLDDLLEAKSSLEEIVRRINLESKRLFAQTFDAVRTNFQHLFRKAFGGGDGDIVLEDPNDVLECGIDIVARPPGKELKSILLMSGGEKTLTAFALLLAIFKCRPSPYCVLDEVDAALDEANVERLTALLTEFQHTTQFIIITHKKPTMTVCDMLYGVTMEQSGVSKRMSVRFEDVSENGEFKTPAGAEVRKAA